MEDPEARGSARQIDSGPTEQDGMGYMHILKLVGVKRCQILILWNKIMNNLNLDVVIVRKFPVVDLRLRGKSS